MSDIEHSPKIRPGQVWLCREHVETPEDCGGCGLTPYLPRFEVETLEAQLAGAVDALRKYGRHGAGCALMRSIAVDNTPRNACDCGWEQASALLGGQ